MAFTGRARVPPPSPDPAEVRLAAMVARHDQVVAHIDELLRRFGRWQLVPARQVSDSLLELRAALRPPPPGRADP